MDVAPIASVFDLPSVNASAIIGNLWQGGAPPEGTALAHHGVKTLVLCAMEHQPARITFPGVKVVRAPNDDGPAPNALQIAMALSAADVVAREVKAKRTTLVTCMQGRNRSGLVVGLALVNLGWDPEKAISHIQKRRTNALQNPHFVELIKRYAKGETGAKK